MGPGQAVNVKGVWLSAKAAIPEMQKQGYGKIVNIASSVSLKGAPSITHYGASKAAVFGITHSMAAEFGDDGICINAIAPGPIETGLSNHGPSRKKGYIDRIPAGAYGTVEAVAKAALFLGSDECEWTTGTVLNVDGGYGAAGLAYDPSEVGG